MANTKRKIQNTAFLQKLTSGDLKPMMEYIRQDEELDIQIRDNYINVYYKGGNILLIRPRSFDFDEFYFYTDCEKKRKTYVEQDAKNGNQNEKEIIAGLKEKRRQLLDKLETVDCKSYFRDAKEVMDEWWKSLECIGRHHKEKEIQHHISKSNNGEDSDFVVLDVEYQVSKESRFCYDGSDPEKKMPRFDIIAIHGKTGRLYVIELKQGDKSTKGKSGVKDHLDSFKHTIGRDNSKAFLTEMKDLYKQKRDLGLISASVEIADVKPEFVFAFEGTELQRKELEKECQKAKYSGKILSLKDYKLQD